MESKYKPSNIIAGVDGYVKDLYSKARDTVRDARNSVRDYVLNPSYTLPTGGYNQGGSYEEVRKRSDIVRAYA